MDSCQTAIKKATQNSKVIDTVGTVVAMDISFSTLYPQYGQLIHGSRIPVGKSYFLYKKMLEYVKEEFSESTTLQACNVEKDVLSFLSQMDEKHRFLAVSIGNPMVSAFCEETSNCYETIKAWYNQILSGHHDEKAKGTSIVSAFESFLQSDYASRLNTNDCVRFHIKCDGLSSDSQSEMRNTFNKLFRRFPNIIIDIDAFVVKVQPTTELSNDTAGVDIYYTMVNAGVVKKLSSFKVHWMLVHDGNEYKPAAEPIVCELAVGDSAGSRVRIADVEVEIPVSASDRELLTRKLFEVLCKHVDYLKTVQPPQMRDLLQNLDSIGTHMPESEMRFLMTLLMDKWLQQHVPVSSINDNLIEEQLNKFVFEPKTDVMLGQRTLRGQKVREANFKAIQEHWGKGNPVINKHMLGAPAIFVNVYDVRHIGVVTLDQMILDKYDNTTHLYDKKFMILPTLGCAGMSNSDYARMSIRRILSTVVEHLGAGKAQTFVKSIEMVGLMTRLAVMARKQDAESEATRILTNLTCKMLDKEQYDRRTRQTKPSALTCIEKNGNVPDEHANCLLFGSPTITTLLYACGKSCTPPTMALPEVHITDVQSKVDIHTYESIASVYYLHVNGDAYTKESMEACVYNGLRNRNGQLYRTSDFKRMDFSSEWDTFINYTLNGEPVNLANLMGVTSSQSRAQASSLSTPSNEVIGVVVPGCIGGGKTTTIQFAINKLTEHGKVVNNSIDVMNKTTTHKAKMFEHHPDSVSYYTGRFNGRAGSQATRQDKNWISSNKHKHLRIVFVNTNAKDAKYLGVYKTKYMPGALPIDCASSMTTSEWEDYLAFAVYNATHRTTGFKPEGALRDKWFIETKKRFNFLPSKYIHLWEKVKSMSPVQIQSGWQRHIDRGYDLDSIKKRVHTFVEQELIPIIN